MLLEALYVETADISQEKAEASGFSQAHSRRGRFRYHVTEDIITSAMITIDVDLISVTFAIKTTGDEE